MKISILIPVYNEVQTITEVISRVQRAALPERCTKEIVVIDDGSTDGTANVLKGYEDGQILRVLRSEMNRGKGAAIRTGLTVAAGGRNPDSRRRFGVRPTGLFRSADAHHSRNSRGCIRFTGSRHFEGNGVA
jgi:glycosyltransferase involved in cell wall biosynthesis